MYYIVVYYYSAVVDVYTHTYVVVKAWSPSTLLLLRIYHLHHYTYHHDILKLFHAHFISRGSKGFPCGQILSPLWLKSRFKIIIKIYGIQYMVHIWHMKQPTELPWQGFIQLYNLFASFLLSLFIMQICIVRMNVKRKNKQGEILRMMRVGLFAWAW